MRRCDEIQKETCGDGVFAPLSLMPQSRCCQSLRTHSCLLAGFRRHRCGCPLLPGIVPLVVEGLGEEDRGYALGDRFGTLCWVETETDSRSRLGSWCTASRDTLNFELAYGDTCPDCEEIQTVTNKDLVTARVVKLTKFCQWITLKSGMESGGLFPWALLAFSA